jgi:histone deacetylase 6
MRQLRETPPDWLPKPAAAAAAAAAAATTATAADGLAEQLSALALAPRKTGIAHDATGVMVLHRDEHDSDHPEAPARIPCIMAAIAEAGLFDSSSASSSSQHCENVTVRAATDKEIYANGQGHSLKHIANVCNVCTTARPQTAKTWAWLENRSLYANPHTLRAARHSCGACLAMTEAVMEGRVRNGLVVARPPGHHAEPCACMGFCFFNNVGVSVLKAKQALGARRILIVDWDVHHGNGTQEMFAEDPDVMMVSLHRYDRGAFYPGKDETTVRADPRYTGRGAGRRSTVNIGWNTPRGGGGMGDGDYLAAFDKIVVPAAREFAPDLIFVSAGFDAAEGDPLGGCDVTPRGYGCMLQMIVESVPSAAGRVIVVLEGGYNLSSIARSALACLQVLTGTERFAREEGTDVASAAGAAAIAATIAAHAGLWAWAGAADADSDANNGGTGADGAGEAKACK